MDHCLQVADHYTPHDKGRRATGDLEISRRLTLEAGYQ